MAVAHAAMSVLARGARYGYELRRALEAELGAEWRVDFGQLYRALGTMVERGWVTFRVEAGHGGPAGAGALAAHRASRRQAAPR